MLRSYQKAFVLALATASLAWCSSTPDVVRPTALNEGYNQMYDLDFSGAHGTFEQWERSHPGDPLGPVSNAAAFLFSEFNRLKILEFDLFVSDSKFDSRPKLSPDPRVKTEFEKELAKAVEIANQNLTSHPQDPRALFALAMANGLRGDYTAMIEKRNLASLTYIKNARNLAEKLLAEDPTYYDAYLAIGVENYLLGINPAPVRWLLKLDGAQTDKEEGIEKLRLTANKGQYLAPYARLLLSVAALRAHDLGTARRLLGDLSREYPQNDLYKKELARIQTK